MSGEKPSEEGIPAGWTVEVKVRKNGKQDKYYVHPSNGLKFNSKPEVFRYLNNIDLNNSKSNGKQKGISKRSVTNSVDEKVEAEGLPSGPITRVRENGRLIKKDLPPAVVEEQKSAETVENRQTTQSQSSKLVGVAKNEQENLGSNDTGDGISLTKDSSDQCMEGGTSSIVNPPADKDLEQKERESGSTTKVCVSAHVPLENGAKRHGIRKAQNDLPRRASKRLAGVKVDDRAAELNYYYNAHKVTPRKSGEAKTSTDEKSGSPNPPEECPKRSEKENEADKKPEDVPVLPLENENVSIPDEHCKKIETEEKPSDLSFADLWSDPCIEFAIKTLTGAIPLEDEIKAEETPNSFQELTFGDSWTDPCIEFAVKTLTGEIPVGEDLSIQDYFQRQSGSAENRVDKGLTLPNSDLDKAMPTLQQKGDGSLQNSGGDGLHHHADAKSDQFPRQTIV